VAGLGAQLVSARPDLDNVSVRHIIERTGDRVSPARYAYRNVAHKPSGPWHEETGYGRINAARAVQAAVNAP
jgi:thermitase